MIKGTAVVVLADESTDDGDRFVRRLNVD